MFSHWRPVALVSVLALSLVAPGISADTQKAKKIVVPTKIDESAEHVDVFEAIEQGLLDVKMVPKDALGGMMFVENKGDKPLNVDFPAAFVGRQVLKQFGGGFGGGQQQQGGFGGGGGLGGGGLGGGGGGQAQGGGLGGGGGGFGGGGLGGGGGGGFGGAGGGGGGFFSVPPDRIVRVAYRSVCLEHGKPEPASRMTYRISKLDEFNDDPVLSEVLKMVASGKLDSQSAQAATWHITDKLSWEELAAKSIRHPGGARPPSPYFSAEQMHKAQQIFTVAVARANENAEKNKSTVAAANDSRKNSATVKRDAR